LHLSRSAGLTLVIASLAIGIGANSRSSASSTRPAEAAAVPEPDRLAVLWLRSPGISIPWLSPGQHRHPERESLFDDVDLARPKRQPDYQRARPNLDEPRASSP
jgi:hypothetical protein